MREAYLPFLSREAMRPTGKVMPARADFEVLEAPFLALTDLPFFGDDIVDGS